ncbi:MAG: hypothetical protein GXP54_01850 [Deltaproteobacteria bacterium]|nr:hypothetical protein [Deltaproteobacteria bacterium]
MIIENIQKVFLVLLIGQAGCAATMGQRADRDDPGHRPYVLEGQSVDGYQTVLIKAPSWVTVTDTGGLDDESVGLGRVVTPNERGYVVLKVKKATAVLIRQHATQHESEIEDLIRFEGQECSTIPGKQRALCPLIGSVESVTPIDGGARVEFKEWVSLDKVLAHSLCHVSFGARTGERGMPGCPLYVPGVHVSKSAFGHALEITDDNKDLAREIRRRLFLVFGK